MALPSGGVAVGEGCGCRVASAGAGAGASDLAAQPDGGRRRRQVRPPVHRSAQSALAGGVPPPACLMQPAHMELRIPSQGLTRAGADATERKESIVRSVHGHRGQQVYPQVQVAPAQVPADNLYR